MMVNEETKIVARLEFVLTLLKMDIFVFDYVVDKKVLEILEYVKTGIKKNGQGRYYNE